MSLTSSPKMNVPGTLVDARTFTLAFTSAGQTSSNTTSSSSHLYNLPNHHIAEYTHTPHSPLIASYRVFGGFYFTPVPPALGVTNTKSSVVGIEMHSPVSGAASFFIPSTPLLDTKSPVVDVEDPDYVLYDEEEEEVLARPSIQRSFAQQDLSLMFASSFSSSSATSSSPSKDEEESEPKPLDMTTSRSIYHTADTGVSYDPEEDSSSDGDTDASVHEAEDQVFEDEDVFMLEDVDKAVLRAAMLFAHQLITSLPPNSPLSTKIHVVRTFLLGYLPTADANAVLSYLPLSSKPEPLPKKHSERIVRVFTTIVEEDEDASDDEGSDEEDFECPPGCWIETLQEEETMFQPMCFHDQCDCRTAGRPVVKVQKRNEKPRPKKMKPSSRTRALSRHSLFYLNSPQL